MLHFKINFRSFAIFLLIYLEVPFGSVKSYEDADKNFMRIS
jgi:hypothetical protein